MDIRVTWWRRYGQNRLLVEENGRRLGWLDMKDGETVVEDETRREEVYSALEAYLRTRPGHAESTVAS